MWRKQWEVGSMKCGLWSLSLACEGRSVEVWSVKCEVWKGEVWSGQNSIVFCNCRIVLAICMGFQVVLVDDLPMEFSRKFRRKRVYFSLHFGASDFPSKNPFKTCVKKCFFRSGINIGFEATISDAVARSSIVFLQLSLCRSHCSRCVTLASCLSFAAGLRRSFWSGCMKAATVICQQIFSILALVIFL